MSWKRAGGVVRRHRALSVAAVAVVSMLGCVRARVDTTPAGRPVLAVVTWNMHAGRGDLRRLMDDLATGRLTGTSIPDFALLLQEAVPGGINDVTRIGRERHLFTAAAPVASRPHHVAVNAILATQPLREVRAVDLPRERQPRGAVVASLHISTENMFLISAHLENRISWLRGGLFSDAARGRQAEALIRELPADRHGIAGGDMNTWLGPAEPAWQALLTRFPDTPPGRAAPTFHEKLVLDHLFFDLPEGWIATRAVVPERYGSDHHPVVGLILSQ